MTKKYAGLLDGSCIPGVYHGQPAPSAAQLVEAGWTVGEMESPGEHKDVVLAGIGVALGFARYYGRNLDALWDCLTDLKAPTLLLWTGWPGFAAAEPRQWAAVMEVLTERTLEGPPFAVVLA